MLHKDYYRKGSDNEIFGRGSRAKMNWSAVHRQS
jgi:hypothetical protein